MTDKNHWKKIEIARKPFDDMARRLFYKAYMKQIEPYMDKLNKSDEYAKMIESDISFSDVPIREAMLTVYEKTGVKFAKSIKKQFGKKELEVNYTESNLIDDKYVQDMRDYALNNSGNAITWISQTAESQALKLVRDILAEGAKEGWSSQKMAMMMRDGLKMGYSNFARYASERIARTEVCTASNYGAQIGAESTGYPMKKRWIATYDGRQRDSHEEAGSKYKDGIDIKEFYIIGDNEKCQHPGSASLSGSERINCRCAQAFEVI